VTTAQQCPPVVILIIKINWIQAVVKKVKLLEMAKKCRAIAIRAVDPHSPNLDVSIRQNKNALSFWSGGQEIKFHEIEIIILLK
jgi:hypothetical protein